MAERGDAIVLIGFMGAGKTSAGRALARRTALPLFDTDEVLAARFGLSVAQIFAQRGEDEFRTAETAALAAILDQPAIVVTGGGIVLRSENVAAMQRLGTIVYLTADDDTLFERATQRATRPLLQTANPRATFENLLRLRARLYSAAADLTLDTSTLERGEVAEAILEGVAQCRRDVAENAKSVANAQS